MFSLSRKQGMTMLSTGAPTDAAGAAVALASGSATGVVNSTKLFLSSGAWGQATQPVPDWQLRGQRPSPRSASVYQRRPLAATAAVNSPRKSAGPGPAQRSFAADSA